VLRCALLAVGLAACTALFLPQAIAQQWYTESQAAFETSLEKMLAVKDFKKSEQEFTLEFDRLWKRVTPLAEKGDPLAQFFLARAFNAAYWSAYKTVLDKQPEALKWARSAAAQDFPPAYALVIEIDTLLLKAGVCHLEPLDYTPKNKSCDELHALMFKGANAGLADMMSSAAAKAELKGEAQQTVLARRYLWDRLALTFSPSIAELGRMNNRFATVRDELIEARKSMEQRLVWVKLELATFLATTDGQKVERDFESKKKSIEVTLTKWSTRYPAMEYGTHGWYRFEK
jgi:hypothetical protein